MPRVSAGRLAAVRVLVDVDKGSFADVATAVHMPTESRERGLARFLSYGALRRQAEVDASIRQGCEPLMLDVAVRAILRIGTFEKLLGVPTACSRSSGS